MRIAVSYENGNVFNHVGDTETFKIYEIVDGKIADTAMHSVNETGRSMVLNFAVEMKIDVLICGRICGGAKKELKETGVEVFGGLTGNAEDAVLAYLGGKLEDGVTSVCEHND